ncbi:hypothetical protein AVM02_06840 [Brucella anthropi]
MSIGTANNERTLTNLAAGRLTATSTDGVNGSQLFATNQSIDTLGATVKTQGTSIMALQTGSLQWNSTASAYSAAHNGTSSSKITNVADGAISASSTDAVNGSQLYAISQKTGSGGWNLSANGKNTTKIAPDTTVDMSNGDGNIVLTQTGPKLAFDLAKDVSIDSLTAGASTLNANGLMIAGGPSVLAGGIDAGNKKVSHVAKGLVDANSSDAVNGSQLFDTNDNIKTLDGKVTTQGTSIATLQANSLQWNADASAFSAAHNGASSSKITNVADGDISASSTDAVNGSQLYTLRQQAGAGWNLSANGGDASNIAPNTTVDMSNGDGNIVLTQTGPKLAFDLAKNVSIDSLTAGASTLNANGLTIASGPSVLAGGIDAGNKKVSHVAAGSVDANSDDAINGSQLHNVAKSITDQLGGDAAIDADGKIRGPSYVIQGTQHQTIYDSFSAVDDNLTALKQQVSGISDGGGIKYFHANSTGADSRATGENSIAVGPDSVASATDSVAMGRNAVASDANSVALGAGSKTAEVVATTGTTINGQRYAFSGDAPVGTVSVGDKGAERTITNVAAGRIAADSTDAVNGSQIYATNQAIGNLQSNVADISQNGIRYDTTPDGKRANSVTLQGGDPNAPVVLSNVAAGVKQNDAVNVGQMEAASTKTLADAKQYTDDVAIQTLGQANSYTDGKIDALNQDIAGLRGDIGDVRSEARQAAAIGLAAASLRYDERPGKLSAAVGGGFWRGEGAFAMGFGYTSLDSKFRTNASMTTAGGKVGAGVGLSYTFN